MHGLITTARESDSVPRVSEIAPQLPVDIDVLQALLVAARAERDAAIVERDQALSQNDRPRRLLSQSQRAQFGRRSEKLDPEQLLLALEDIEQAIAGDKADDDKKNPAAARVRAEKRRANRGALPAHLPRVDVTIEPDDTSCPCCRAPKRIDAVFDIEREINGRSIAERLAVRRERVAPLVADLETWMREQRAKFSRHSDVGKAMDYMLKQGDKCRAHTTCIDAGQIGAGD